MASVGLRMCSSGSGCCSVTDTRVPRLQSRNPNPQVHWKREIVGENRKEKDYKSNVSEWELGCAAASLWGHTVVSIVSITSISHCEGDRSGHSSGSQLLSGL